MGVREPDPLSELCLPPGFRFYPTDEELLVQYLCRRIAGHQFSLRIIGDIDLYKFDPWDLPSKAVFGEKEWYFFSPRDRKYPNGSRPNRVAGSGYWKATGTDKIIMNEGRKVGIKKSLVFYIGKAPKGTKTNWIMHEYRLSEAPRKNGSVKLDEWVLCRIYKKYSSAQQPAAAIGDVQGKEYSHGTSSSSSSQHDYVFEPLPEIDERILSLPRVDSLKCLQHLGSGNFDWATLAGLSSLPEPGQADAAEVQPAQQQMDSDVDGYNGVYAPLNQFGANVGEEEVQSGNPGLRVGRGVFGHDVFGSTGPFFTQYSTQPAGSGFRH